jgi:ABC-type branched-subunit amino acid transport system ATPase component
MSESFLDAASITVRFGGLTAVEDVSVAVDRGEVAGLIGPNGAGKTTMFGAVFGLNQPVNGTVQLGGVDATRWPPHRRARAGLGRTFQRLELFGSMTIRETFAFATEAFALGSGPWRLFGGSRHQHPDVVDATLDLLGLCSIADELTGGQPLGIARLIELGRAMCASPTVLLLDEPSSGLDAMETAVFADVLRKAVADRHVGVLLIEHDMSLVLDLCERVTVLDFGKEIAAGPTAEVANREEVRAAYLGEVDVNFDVR